MKHETTDMLAHKVELYAEANDHILNTRNVIEILKVLDYTILNNKEYAYVEKNGLPLNAEDMCLKMFSKD